MNKPIKPNITVPESFAKNGVKTDFDSDLIASGFDRLKPDVLAGDNLNKFIDDTYQGLNYGMAAADAINLIKEGETLTVVDGKLTSGASGGGLEIGDIGFTQMAIDESKGKRRKLNGQLIIQDQYAQLTNIIKASVALNPDLACTEEEWQTTVTMSANGLCDKFVIDDEGGTIRLPKCPDYFIGGLSGIAPSAGNGNALGLTNGVKNFALATSTQSYPWCLENAYGMPTGTAVEDGTATGARIPVGVTTDPANSGIEAHLSNDQAELIKGTYFIQVATGSETEDNITNELELVNPYVLLEPKYFETEVYNPAWLRANGSFNGSSATHPSVYNALLIELNADIAVGETQNNYTKRGLPVKLSTDTYTDEDFVVNTAEETFRLRLKVNLASSKAVAGNGIALGMYAYTGDEGAVTLLPDNSIQINSEGLGQPPMTLSTQNSNYTSTMAVTQNPNYSGLETKDNGLYLYFYVGETVQNANLINAGRIEEKVADLIPNNSSLIAGYAMPSNRYIDLTLGASGTTYTAPANGWVFFRGSTSTTTASIFFTNQTAGLMEASGYAPFKNVSICSFMCVSKNDLFTLTYTDVNKIFFRFIYAEGEV